MNNEQQQQGRKPLLQSQKYLAAKQLLESTPEELLDMIPHEADDIRSFFNACDCWRLADIRKALQKQIGHLNRQLDLVADEIEKRLQILQS